MRGVWVVGSGLRWAPGGAVALGSYACGRGGSPTLDQCTHDGPHSRSSVLPLGFHPGPCYTLPRPHSPSLTQELKDAAAGVRSSAASSLRRLDAKMAAMNELSAKYQQVCMYVCVCVCVCVRARARLCV